MLAVALAADITRNSSFVFTLPAAHVFYRSLGTDMNDDFHDTICHGDPGDNASQTRVHRGVVYAMQALAYFLEKLASYTEGTATVLDNSLVYVTSCTAWGKIHDVVDWPVLFAGKAGGALRANQHYRAEGRNLSDALLTIAKIFGSTVASVGKGTRPDELGASEPSRVTSVLACAAGTRVPDPFRGHDAASRAPLVVEPHCADGW